LLRIGSPNQKRKGGAEALLEIDRFRRLNRMRQPALVSLVLLFVGFVGAPPDQALAAEESVTVELPGGSGGIGFDDLQFSSSLDKVLVPGGRTGSLFLVDPKTRSVSAIGGFSPTKTFGGGHGEGITSVSEGESHLYATDRTGLVLVVVDSASKRITARARLAASPDYVRYVAPTREVWVTEPDKDQIEVFKLSDQAGSAPSHAALVPIQNGPESLVVDVTRGRAYTHLWSDTTLAIDLKTRSVAARWKNQCKDSRGIALDETKGFLFVACSEGRAAVLDVAHDGRVLGNLQTAARGVDIIDYDKTLHHLYLPGANSATLTILGVGSDGSLKELGKTTSPAGGHCGVSDQQGHAYVCDPKRGRLMVFQDRYAPSAWR
jgi:DNA-binding beta-propeller fold protein YncE